MYSSINIKLENSIVKKRSLFPTLVNLYKFLRNCSLSTILSIQSLFRIKPLSTSIKIVFRKSSLSLSITSYFSLDIYILSLSTINEASLKSLFTKLLSHYIILLEDIDVISSNRSRDTKIDSY